METEFSNLSDGEFMAHVARLIEALATRLIRSHWDAAELAKTEKAERMVSALLHQSAAYVAESLGNLCNNIELIDDEESIWTAPIFEELHRRCPGLKHTIVQRVESNTELAS